MAMIGEFVVPSFPISGHAAFTESNSQTMEKFPSALKKMPQKANQKRMLVQSPLTITICHDSLEILNAVASESGNCLRQFVAIAVHKLALI